MNESEDTKDGATPQPSAATVEPREGRELLLMRAGARHFAVFADEAEGVAEGLRPARLPRAPNAVLGVVCLRGRMLTLLDPLALVRPQEEVQTSNTTGDDAYSATPRFAVALRGDEQLALAVETIVGVIRVREDELAAPEHSAQPLRATLERDGARVHILDPSRIFDAAMQGTERRRQRQ